jgi:hypothetical protein
MEKEPDADAPITGPCSLSANQGRAHSPHQNPELSRIVPGKRFVFLFDDPEAG